MSKQNKLKRKFYRTNEFIKLQNEWYNKLSKSGFDDLEWLDKNSGAGQDSPFLRKNLWKFSSLDTETLEKTSEYFTSALQFAQDFKFPTRLHKYVWQLYCEGVSYRDMRGKIYSRGFKHVPSIFWISTHLNKLKKDFVLWQLDQPDEPETLSDFLESNTWVDDGR